jgi:hypothetical protein
MNLTYLGKANRYSTTDCFWRLENGLKMEEMLVVVQKHIEK